MLYWFMCLYDQESSYKVHVHWKHKEYDEPLDVNYKGVFINTLVAWLENSGGDQKKIKAQKGGIKKYEL